MRGKAATIWPAAVAVTAVLCASPGTAAAMKVDAVQAAGASTCTCTTTGDYVDPDGGSTVSGQQTSSPHGTYTATWQSNGTVTVKKGAQQVMSTDGTIGGFSPDDHAFVTEALNGGVATVRLFNLDAPSPGSQIWGATATLTSSRLVFSASGHYLLLGYTTASQTFLDVADTTATSQESAFTSGGISTSGPPGSGDDEFGSLIYGFGPDDSRFLYAYLSSPTQAAWRWTDLSDSQHAIRSFATSGSSAYAQFSPCGDVLGIVNGFGSGTVTASLFDSSTGQALGQQGSGSTQTKPVLEATATEHVFHVGGLTQDLAPNTCTGSGGGGGGGGGGTNQPPQASFDLPSQVRARAPATFTDTSTDPDGTIASWHWDFGDGTTSSDRDPTHTYSDPAGGTFTVALTVTDDDGATDTVSHDLTVAAAQPITIHVTTTADPSGAGGCPNAPCSLRQAVAAAGEGDTIQLSTGTYVLTQATQLTVDRSVTIAGDGAGATTIDGSQNADQTRARAWERIMRIEGGAVDIHDVAFTGGIDENDEQFAFCSPCSTLSANGGGALLNAGGAVTLERVAFHGNAGSGNPVGGAVANRSGTLTMTDVSFAHDSAGLGGGLYVSGGTVSGDGVTFEDEGGEFGGGAILLNGGNTTLVNTTVTGSGVASSRGGGIENAQGVLTLRNATLAGNLRGSLETDAGASTSVENTIIGAGFSDGDGDCVASGLNTNAGPPTRAAVSDDLGHNLDEDGSCGLTGDGDVSGVAAHVATIADNTGPTRTMALLHGSPAIDAADGGDCPAHDQRGTARPSDACDIGAYEAVLGAQPSATTGQASDVTASTATLAGTVNAGGEPGAYQFRWGTAPDALTHHTDEIGTGVLGSSTPETAHVDGLRAGTTYSFEIVAETAAGVHDGGVQSFTTDPGPPVISDVNVDAVTDTTAKIAFSIDPAGADTHYVIRYGKTSAYGQATNSVDLGASGGAQQLSGTLTDLQPNTRYHFDVVATNSEAPQGVDGGDMQFSTAKQLAGSTGTPLGIHDSGDVFVCPNATIDWGDGTPPTQGTVKCTDDGGDGQAYELSAQHTYAAPGHYAIHVEYTGQQPDDVLGSFDTFAQISKAVTPTPTPTHTPSPTPTPSGGTTPPPTPRADTTPPRLIDAGLSGRKLKLRVSEAAAVTAKLARCRTKRVHGHKRTVCRTVKTLHGLAAKAGALQLRLPRKLKAGRYRVTVRATDAAGNRSKPLVREVRLKR